MIIADQSLEAEPASEKAGVLFKLPGVRELALGLGCSSLRIMLQTGFRTGFMVEVARRPMIKARPVPEYELAKDNHGRCSMNNGM